MASVNGFKGMRYVSMRIMSADKRLTAGVILAGGQSRRMGQSKALLPYKGARLIDHRVHTLKSAQLDVYVSGQVAPFACIPDEIPARGPVGGVMSAATFLTMKGFQAALFVPVDMPLLTPALLTALIQRLGEHEAVYYQAHPLPICLSLSPKVLRVL